METTDTTQNALRDCNHFLGKQVYQVSNASLAFGPQAANILSAESRQICWSGKGIYRNADNTETDLMPEVWTRSIATDGNTTYNLAEWIPQAVVIDLGTNDYGSVGEPSLGGTPNQDTFKKRYLGLVKQVRKAYPNAWILLAVGPMLSDYYPKNYHALTLMRENINSVLGEMGDGRIKYFEFPLNISSDLDETGCEWHPDVAQDTHALSDSSAFLRFTDLPTADVEDPDAVLTVRSTPHGAGSVVPRASWRFPTAAKTESRVVTSPEYYVFFWTTERLWSSGWKRRGLSMQAETNAFWLICSSETLQETDSQVKSSPPQDN